MSEPLTAEILAAEPSDDHGASDSTESVSNNLSSGAANRARRPSDIKRPVPSDGSGPADPTGDKPQKHPGAYERAKERVKAKEAAIAQRDSELTRREAALAERERLAAEAAKPKPKQRDYTLADLRKYHKQWSDVSHRNYDPDLAEKAAAEIEVMENEQAQVATGAPDLPGIGTPEHTRQWQQAEKELAEADPEFMRTGTKLDARLRAIMQGPDGDAYRTHPRGIVAAYHQAKLDLTREENKELSDKIQSLETELKRYQGLTSVGSGVSRRPGSNGHSPETPQEFARLSSDQMRKHLLSRARASGGAPLF